MIILVINTWISLSSRALQRAARRPHAYTRERVSEKWAGRGRRYIQKPYIYVSFEDIHVSLFT